MNWGVPVPLPGWENKAIYVWFDAVIGYLSASKEWAKNNGQPDSWKAYWMDPDVRSYYFLGKDNIPFHTLIWPAMLMGCGGLNLPYDVPANEFLKFKGDKLSKSRGTAIDVPTLLKSYDAELIRFYVTANMPENKDTDFSWEDFETKINNELVATLGNFYHRVLSFTYKNYGIIPEFKDTKEEHDEVIGMIIRARQEVDDAISHCHFKIALKAIMDLAKFGNRYFDSVGPWALIKKDRERCGTVLNLSLELVRALAILSYPILPRSSRRIWGFLGYDTDIETVGWNSIDISILSGQTLREPLPLFSKVAVEKDEANAAYRPFESLNLRVGQVVKAQDHPNSDHLLLLEVDIGRNIQIVAGLKAYYSPEAILGKKVVVVSNLKPAKLRGYESQGMLLAAEGDGKVVLVSPPEDSMPGERVNSGLTQSEKLLDFKDFQKLPLSVGTVTEKGKVDIGRTLSCRCTDDSIGKKVPLFLPAPDATECLAFYTEKGKAVTVDDLLPNGAIIR